MSEPDKLRCRDCGATLEECRAYQQRGAIACCPDCRHRADDTNEQDRAAVKQLVQRFSDSMHWSADATDDLKTLVMGNIIGFSVLVVEALAQARQESDERIRLATQLVIEEIGSIGPENLESAIGRLIVKLQQARQEEREACAKVVENGRFLHDDAPDARFGKACAQAIRARGDI